jgi:urease accessory protein
VVARLVRRPIDAGRVDVKAAAHLAVGSTGGRAYARDVRAEPPFAIRRTGERFVVVGSAAAPVRGDELALTLDVAAGAVVAIGTVAATMVWPGPPEHAAVPPSRLTTTIAVGAGGHLDWWPEPTVSVGGSDHVASTRVDLGAQATCRIVEEYSLGRYGEPSGRLATDLRVTRGARPLVHHGELFGPDVPGAGSVARLGAARHVIAAVIVGAAVLPSEVVLDVGGASAARLAVADDVNVVLAAGPDRPSVLALWERLATPGRSGAGT